MIDAVRKRHHENTQQGADERGQAVHHDPRDAQHDQEQAAGA